MNKRISGLFAVLVGGLLLAIASGCAGGNPFVGRAEENLQQGDFEQALVAVDSALAREPQNVQIYLLRARILSQQADSLDNPERHAELVRAAIEAQEEAISIDPSLRSEVQTRRQLEYIQEMRTGAQAFQTAQQSQDDAAFRRAAAHFEAAHVIYPDSASAYLNQAYALINAGQQEAAIQPMSGYIERADSVAADQYTLLAQLYLSNNRPADAIPVLEAGIEQYPDNSDIQALLLNAYNAAGRTEEAIQAYRDQVQRNPDNPLYQYNLGSLLLQNDRYEEAIQHLQRAVELEPSNVNAQYNLGAAYTNRAVAINDQISALEDSLRSNENSLSQAEREELNARIEELVQLRQELFQQAIPPLERARQMAGPNAENLRGICRALFTAYVQTEQQQKAQAVEECAGFTGGQQQ